MFQFGFGNNTTSEGESKNVQKEELEWFPAREIVSSFKDDETELQINEHLEKELFPNVRLKLVKIEHVINKLKDQNCDYILEAESQHSDLLPSKYEGGLKIWECTYDLGNYILDQNLTLKDKLVLDLGCGSGIIGLLALQNGANVHFQDYNTEIIKHITISNVKINNLNLEKCKFYSGDWGSFANMLYKEQCEKYDFIFTSETIYNADNHDKLFNVFKCLLKKGGVGLVAGKVYYFGVGGGMRQFDNLVIKNKDFRTEVVWTSDTGLQREILKLTKDT